ncbi:FMN-binding protein [Cryobacterium sp. PH31-AA6]|uniref:FMN-binding protein n=1 Tax=Cryobacterium sp. PH31-AA6 TaxID=3046205 RepID=UPI0024B904BE|nr:FMN-binding protein [Cryobacterium sp. PH31-AA6]MDJ0324150.1 FMN-binding protein [Cryobacterium sp. PH31-AA6]
MRFRALSLAALASLSVVGIGWQMGAQLTASQQTLSAVPVAPAAHTGTAATVPNPTALGPAAPAATGSPAATTAPAAPAGAASGTFDGSVVQTRFGPVQVSVTIASGSITEVTALQLTNDGGRSVMISNQAAPILRSEVLTAQSAQVQNVSGATYTTHGYLTSLQAALDAAQF